MHQKATHAFTTSTVIHGLQPQPGVIPRDQTADFAPLLMALYRPHPDTHNSITELTGSEKTAPVVRRAATIKEYSTHLSPAAREGIGALGMYLGERVQDGDKVWWSMSYLVLDFDTKGPADLVPLIDTLAGFSITTYATTGTTGRGAHLYLFLSPLLHHKRAYSVVKLFQTVASEAGLGLPETRPSGISGMGSPIFLPYRAAGEDGFGVNPLLNPADDFRPISLVGANKQIKRVSSETLEAFSQEIQGKVSGSSYRHHGTFPTTTPARGETRAGDGLALLETELERLADVFVNPHRQNLVMGVTAYAVRALGLDPTKVRPAVERFIKENDPDELQRRLQAVERTIKKHASGQLVAWHEFYGCAGIEAPHKIGPFKEVVEQLERAEQFVLDYAWPGRGGASDRSAYTALLQVAAVHGVLHDDGVAVSISVRNLAVNARLGNVACRKALARLTEVKLLSRDTTVKRRFEDAKVLVLLKAKVHELCHSITQTGGLREWHSLYTHPACMHGKLGKSAAALLITLLEAEKPLTRPALAKQLGKDSRAIRTPLTKLLDHNVVQEDGRAFEPVADWPEALERAARDTGAYRSLERQKERHTIEREIYRRTLATRWRSR
jgi:hypothetical protein